MEDIDTIRADRDVLIQRNRMLEKVNVLLSAKLNESHRRERLLIIPLKFYANMDNYSYERKSVIIGDHGQISRRSLSRLGVSCP